TPPTPPPFPYTTLFRSPASHFFPRTGDAGEHGNGSGRHATTLGALDSLIQSDDGGASRGVLAGKLHDVGSGNAGPPFDTFWRVLLRFFAQLIEPRGVFRDVIGIMEAIFDNDVHHA